jgi:hypothetical protein
MTAFRWEAKLNQGHNLNTVTTAIGHKGILKNLGLVLAEIEWYHCGTVNETACPDRR